MFQESLFTPEFTRRSRWRRRSVKRRRSPATLAMMALYSLTTPKIYTFASRNDVKLVHAPKRKLTHAYTCAADVEHWSVFHRKGLQAQAT